MSVTISEAAFDALNDRYVDAELELARVRAQRDRYRRALEVIADLYAPLRQALEDDERSPREDRDG